MYLESIYRELREVRLCGSAYEFSTNYLGKARSYYGVLKARNKEPSIEALAMLELSLQNKASYYDDNSVPFIVNTRNRLIRMSKDVSEHRIDLCQKQLQSQRRARYMKKI